jgi:hypothetical protein
LDVVIVRRRTRAKQKRHPNAQGYDNAEKLTLNVVAVAKACLFRWPMTATRTGPIRGRTHSSAFASGSYHHPPSFAVYISPRVQTTRQKFARPVIRLF